jgi:hypothetical protein
MRFNSWSHLYCVITAHYTIGYLQRMRVYSRLIRLVIVVTLMHVTRSRSYFAAWEGKYHAAHLPYCCRCGGRCSRWCFWHLRHESHVRTYIVAFSSRRDVIETQGREPATCVCRPETPVQNSPSSITELVTNVTPVSGSKVRTFAHAQILGTLLRGSSFRHDRRYHVLSTTRAVVGHDWREMIRSIGLAALHSCQEFRSANSLARIEP